MPRTSLKNDPGIYIELDSPQRYGVVPGDILTGFVVLKPTYRAFVHVRLTLFGRTKTKISRNNSQTTAIYRGRRLFFEIHQTLHSERDGCKSGEHAWPFAIDIPKRPSPGAKYGDHYKPEFGFLSTEEDMTKHNLPSIYYYYAGAGMGMTKAEAYVEYALKVEVSEKVNSSFPQSASIPLALRAPSTKSPITDFKMKSGKYPIMIQTRKLLPEPAEEVVSARKKMKSFFRPAPVPQFFFQLKVEYPTVVQLEHPDPIPLRISLVPDLENDKTTIDAATLPDVRVTGISMYLRSTTTIRAPSTFHNTRSDKTHDFNFSFARGFRPFVIPVIRPPAVTTTSNIDAIEDGAAVSHVMAQSNEILGEASSANEDYDPVLNTLVSGGISTISTGSKAKNTVPEPGTTTPTSQDLGHLLKLHLTRMHSSAQGLKAAQFERPLTPTFSTYNINVRYEIRWKISFECAGEYHSVSNYNNAYNHCLVLAPSETQVRSQEKLWMGKDRGGDWDEVNNMVSIAGQGLQAVLGLLG